MSFHIEHTVKGHLSSADGFESRGEAVLAALRTKAAPVLVIDDESSGGEVAAVVLKGGEILTARAEPDWWARISEKTRTKLLAGGRLDADAVTELTDAGGAVAAEVWDGGPLEEWELTPSGDQDWVRFEAARRQVRGK